jgi:hypothetical protein
MFSLKSLLLMVAVAGLGTAGLIHRTQIWASTLVALTLGVVLFSSYRAWFVPKTRVFWGPFAVTGAVYLSIVSLQPLVELHYNLPTTQLVTYGLEKLQEKAATSALRPPVTGYYTPAPSFYAAPTTTYTPDVTQSELLPSDEPGDVPATESSSGSIKVIRRPVEVVTRDPVSNAETREVREVEEVVAAEPPTSSSTTATTSAPSQVLPPAVAYSAPVISPVIYSYNRQMLFQMASTRNSGDGFAVEARAFLWVAQCLWCLLLSFVMGMTCSWLLRSVQSTA